MADDLALTFSDRVRLAFDRPMTAAQRERLAVLAVSGEPEGPTLWRAQTRLTFARELVESGRLGRGDVDE